ncbi:hypothetical protein GCM10010384_44360 [Streptomyces djakartensis]|uniref:DUF305 domain-containing protein n=1 Tax=Streptomyces djakartensis TaxID=68193 RepID=A0ABQ3A2I1_9ACTN|nr:hypothetical protein GCM10010384_44360 [Streptomyces djakartensis]
MVQHHEAAVRLETGAPQVIGAGQTGLTGAYDDHLDLVCLVHTFANRARGVDLPHPYVTMEAWQMSSPPES